MKIVIFTLLIVAVFYACEEPDDYEYNYQEVGVKKSYMLLSSISGEEKHVEGEKYNSIEENPFFNTHIYNTSTFSIDADGAAYSNVRRFVNEGFLPPKEAIRTEELINYFIYDYEEPEEGERLAINYELTECPWNVEHNLLRIGIKGQVIPREQLPSANLVLLIDVSGSMSMDGKLTLLKKSFSVLINNLRSNDKVAIVAYSGEAGVLFPSSSLGDKQEITEVLNKLEAAGSTAGAEGIVTAYEIATNNFIPNGNNRVIVATDGDFNVGPSSKEEIISLIKTKRETGIYLTVIGVGKENLNEAMLEQVSNRGNGNYEYIDNLKQAEKVFNVEYGKFYSVARDVKLKVEFNPLIVEQYRLIGYENRLIHTGELANEDKDAGEIGAGQTVSALFELVKYNKDNKNIANIKLKYSDPENNKSKVINSKVLNEVGEFNLSSHNMKFTASVAAFSLKARNSVYRGDISYETIKDMASSATEYDPYGYRKEFVELVSEYELLSVEK